MVQTLTRWTLIALLAGAVFASSAQSALAQKPTRTTPPPHSAPTEVGWERYTVNDGALD